MSDDKYTINDDPILKKIFLFLTSTLVLSGILLFAFPDSLYFLSNNFEYILLAIIIILSSLVLLSILDLNFPNNNKSYGTTRKIVTLEGFYN